MLPIEPVVQDILRTMALNDQSSFEILSDANFGQLRPNADSDNSLPRGNRYDLRLGLEPSADSLARIPEKAETTRETAQTHPEFTSNDGVVDRLGNDTVCNSVTCPSNQKEETRTDKTTPIPVEASVFGAGGFVLEDEEKADAAATAFKNHQPPPPAHPEDGTDTEKKGPQVIEKNGVAPTGTASTTDREETRVGLEGETETEDLVFPGNTQLAFLTFGLCVATFTVALG